MAEKYISIRVILDKIMRHPMLSDVTLETVVDYTVDFMRIVGMPRMFMDKVCDIEISEYRGVLPSDWVDTNHIRMKGTCLPVRQSSDVYLTGDSSRNFSLEPVFSIQGGIIYCSVDECTLEMSYKAMMTDDDGYPMIIDDSMFTRALESYIKLRRFEMLFDLGKISQVVYNNAQQQYAWNVGSCQSHMVRLDAPSMENVLNLCRQLVTRDNEYSRGFATLGRRGRAL